jgi:hypothetical protein
MLENFNATAMKTFRKTYQFVQERLFILRLAILYAPLKFYIKRAFHLF